MTTSLSASGRLPLTAVCRESYVRVTALEQLDKHGEVTWSDSAEKIWASEYEKLSEGKPGLLGAVTGRSEAQTLRLALTYTLLDGSTEIRPEHVKAALAVWRYCEASVVYLFGDRLGDPVADEILRALKANPDGLTRTDIRELFARHERSSSIDIALTALFAQGLANFKKRATGGRPEERWFAR